MARYIDADKLLKRIQELQETDSATVGKKQFADGYFLGLDEAEVLLKGAPTADVVEVVRCRNCQHAYFRYNCKDTLQEIYACKKRPAGRTHKKVGGDFWCAHGKRKETE